MPRDGNRAGSHPEQPLPLLVLADEQFPAATAHAGPAGALEVGGHSGDVITVSEDFGEAPEIQGYPQVRVGAAENLADSQGGDFPGNRGGAEQDLGQGAAQDLPQSAFPKGQSTRAQEEDGVFGSSEASEKLGQTLVLLPGRGHGKPPFDPHADDNMLFYSGQPFRTWPLRLFGRVRWGRESGGSTRGR